MQIPLAFGVVAKNYVMDSTKMAGIVFCTLHQFRRISSEDLAHSSALGPENSRPIH